MYKIERNDMYTHICTETYRKYLKDLVCPGAAYQYPLLPPRPAPAPGLQARCPPVLVLDSWTPSLTGRPPLAAFGCRCAGSGSEARRHQAPLL